jgi:hypothetical protein
MSNLAIAAAHFAGPPARYVVGRWSSIPTNTLLVFNATDLGLNILARSIINYVASKCDGREDEHQQDNRHLLQLAAVGSVIVIRTLICLIAVYVTSKLTEPMPLKQAALTNLAAFASVVVATALAKWGKEEK